MRQALLSATLKLLQPLVRVLLRHGISYGEFAELAKWVYVDRAYRELAIPGRKPSYSRASLLTGLSRKEVVRVHGSAYPSTEAAERYGRAARIVSAWVREPEFHDPDGELAVLRAEGPGASFAELVRRFGGDVPTRAVLDELERVGTVERTPGGGVRLLTRAYVPAESEGEKLQILGSDVADLIAAIDHNITAAPAEAFFQRKVAYDNLSAEAMPEVRRTVAKKGQALLEQLDRELSKRDRDTNPEVQGTGRRRAMVGVYYYETDCPAGDAPAGKATATGSNDEDTANRSQRR
ncbi:MAG: DUF6502 family protein [Deferrisomatales bacterium]